MTEPHEELISRYIEDRLSGEELKKIESLILSDADVRRRLLLSASLETELSGILVAEASADRVPVEGAADTGGSTPGPATPRKRSVREPKRSMRSRVIPPAVAAGVMACLICGIAIQSTRKHPGRPETAAPAAGTMPQPQRTTTSPTARPVKPGLTVAALKGTLRVSPAGPGQATTLKRDDTIPTGATVSIGKNGAATLHYPDDSSLEFGAGAQFRFADKPTAGNVHILRGQLMADIKHQARETLCFTTPDAILRVVGTRFWIYVCPVYGSFLKVQEGQIELTRNIDRRTSIIGAGQSAKVGRAGVQPRSMKLHPTTNRLPAKQGGDKNTSTSKTR